MGFLLSFGPRRGLNFGLFRDSISVFWFDCIDKRPYSLKRSHFFPSMALYKTDFSLRQSLEIIRVLAVTDFKLRYYGSYLGYLWSLLKPLALFSVLYIVFSVFMRWDVANYQLYLLLGIILWNFFAESTSVGVTALAARSHLIKKVYFPRIVAVIATAVSALLGLLLNLLVFFVFAFLSGLPLSSTVFLAPFFLVLLFFLILGISLLLSGLYIPFRDINQIWEVLLQLLFWLTPIVYPLSFVPEQYRFWLFLNPMTGIIQYIRILTIDGTFPSLMGTLYVFCAVVCIFLAGLFVFSRFESVAPEQL